MDPDRDARRARRRVHDRQRHAAGARRARGDRRRHAPGRTATAAAWKTRPTASGLRYAYEAGYDITKGPRLWNRFAKKYGEGNKAANFFFSDHSLSAARATKLEKEIAYNYPDGPKPDGPAQASRPAPAAGRTTVAIAPVAVPAGAQALAARGSAAAAPASAPGPGSKRTEIKPGMTSDEVRRALGEPEAEVVFGEKTRWTYPGMTVVFVKGKVPTCSSRPAYFFFGRFRARPAWPRRRRRPCRP